MILCKMCGWEIGHCGNNQDILRPRLTPCFERDYFWLKTNLVDTRILSLIPSRAPLCCYSQNKVCGFSIC